MIFENAGFEIIDKFGFPPTSIRQYFLKFDLGSSWRYSCVSFFGPDMNSRIDQDEVGSLKRKIDRFQDFTSPTGDFGCIGYEKGTVATKFRSIFFQEKIIQVKVKKVIHQFQGKSSVRRPSTQTRTHWDVFVQVNVEIWKIWKIQVPEHPKSIYGLLKLEFIELSDNKSINFYHSQLTAFNVFHALDKITALAFRLKTAEGVFTYSGDSGLCPGLEKAADKTDVFLCDASADIGDDKSKTSGHLNPFQAGSLADRIGVKKLWLTHYSGKNSPEEMIANCKSAGFGGEIRVLRDGDRLFPF